MSWEGKVQEVRAVLRDHFGASGKVDELVTKITQLGATSEESAAMLSEGDLEAEGLPRLVARRVVRLFGGVQTADELPRQIVLVDDDPDKLARRMKPADLIAEYDPEEPDNAFGIRLKEISKGHPFLVFNEDNSKNEPVSLKLLQEIRLGYPPRKSITVNGVPHQIYAVGARPAVYADEHPIRPGQMLRPDGYSDLGVPWLTLTMAVRQLMYIAYTVSKEISENTQERYYWDLVKNETFEEVAQRFPNGYIAFKEMEGAQKLPSLRVVLKPAVSK